MPNNKQFTLDRIFRIIISIIIVLGFIALLSRLDTVLLPFIIAILLAYFINPLVLLIKKIVRKNGIAITLALAIISGFLFLFAWLIVPLIVSEIKHMAELINLFTINSGIQERAKNLLNDEIWEYLKNILTNFNAKEIYTSSNLEKVAGGISEHLLPNVFNIFSSSLNFIFSILSIAFIIMYLIFILIDYEKIMRDWKNYLPNKIKDKSVMLVSDFSNAMKTYFRSQALIASITGILFAIGFSIINLPMGIILGLFIGSLNMVPYLQILGVLPASFIALMYSLETGESFWVTLGYVGIIFTIIQIIQDGFLTPKIMGKSSGLNPAIILLSLSVWGNLLGFIGLVIAIPLTTVIISYYKRFVLDK